ncbi:MAG: YraN family protein [Candidatus Zixiibacteriota bacterium]|nr:MAG: YraN family protein [candidate division Zixibacteria bacterium]
MPSSNRDPNLKKKTVAVGRRFEARAETFYSENGYEIIERNWRAGRKEIDLIVRKDSVLAFVEVKAASSTSFGHPSEKVDEKKRAHLTEAAHRFIAERGIKGVDFRFDVITFVRGKLEHFPGAFEATG